MIYIESTLRSISKLRENIIDFEVEDIYSKNPVSIHTNDDSTEESLLSRQSSSDPNKLLDILNMLCTQAKFALEKERHLERLLKQLLSTRRTSTIKDISNSSMKEFS